jgi:hypothetical protein
MYQNNDKCKLKLFIVTNTHRSVDIFWDLTKITFLPCTESYMAHLIMVLGPKHVVYWVDIRY